MSPDLHTLTGAYATDALPDAERAQFEEHLRVCSACAEEVRELQATAARLALATARPAPAGLRAQVLDQISAVRQLPPAPAHQRPPASAPVWWRTPLAYAAALLLVVSVAFGAAFVRQQQQLDEANATARQIAAIATDPDRVSASAPAAGGGDGAVVAAGGDAVFVASGLGALPSDKAYQLWMIGPSGIRSGGVLDVSDGTTQKFVADLGDAESMAVSVEPRNGSEQPTTEPVWSVELA